MASGINVDEQMKQNLSGVAASTIARPMATYGEQFGDGSSIELIGGVRGGNPQLVLGSRPRTSSPGNQRPTLRAYIHMTILCSYQWRC